MLLTGLPGVIVSRVRRSVWRGKGREQDSQRPGGPQGGRCRPGGTPEGTWGPWDPGSGDVLQRVFGQPGGHTGLDGVGGCGQGPGRHRATGPPASQGNAHGVFPGFGFQSLFDF